MNRLTRKFMDCFALFHLGPEHFTSGYPVWLRLADLCPSHESPARGNLSDGGENYRRRHVTGAESLLTPPEPRPGVPAHTRRSHTPHLDDQLKSGCWVGPGGVITLSHAENTPVQAVYTTRK